MWLVLALFFAVAWAFGLFVVHVAEAHVLGVIAILALIAHFTLGHHHPPVEHPFDQPHAPR